MNLFDAEMSAIARSDLYRSYLVPESFPDERPARIQNWSAEEREAYCGIYEGAR